MQIRWLLSFLLVVDWVAGSIRLEEVETYGVASFQHASTTSEVVCHPDGVHVLSSSRDNCVRLWEIKSGKLVRRFTVAGSGSMWGIRFVNGGKEFLAASSSNKVYRFEVATGKVLMSYSHPDDVYRLALHPDGKHFVATGSGKLIILWETATGKKVRTFNGHTGDVYTAIVTEGGKRIISGSSDDTIRQWDLESGKCLKTLKEKPKYDDIFTLALSPDGKHFVVVSDDHCARVFESGSLEEVWKSKLKQEGQVVAWSPDGGLVATASKDGHLYLLSAATGAEVRKIKTAGSSHTPITFSNDGTLLISGGDRTLHLHEVATGERIRPGMGFSTRARAFEGLAVGNGGRCLYTADGNRLERRDRAEAGDPLAVKETSEISALAISDDGAFLAIGTKRGQVVIRETAGLSKVLSLQGSGEIKALDFSPGGSRLVAAGSRGAARVWTLPAGNKIADLTGHRDTVNDVAFVGEGDQVMTAADDRTVRVWAVADGRELVSTKVADFNPDDFLSLDQGRTLLVSGENRKLYGRILEKLEVKEISDRGEVERLVEQLGDEEFERRETAMKSLAGYGRAIIPVLEEVETRDPEVRARLIGVRNVMRGSLGEDELAVVKEFEEEISKVTADPRGRFWVGCLGGYGVEKVVVGVIDHQSKGVEIIQTLDGIHGCTRLVVAPDGSHVGSINADGTTTLYRVVEK